MAVPAERRVYVPTLDVVGVDIHLAAAPSICEPSQYSPLVEKAEGSGGGAVMTTENPNDFMERQPTDTGGGNDVGNIGLVPRPEVDEVDLGGRHLSTSAHSIFCGKISSMLASVSRSSYRAL